MSSAPRPVTAPLCHLPALPGQASLRDLSETATAAARLVATTASSTVALCDGSLSSPAGVMSETARLRRCVGVAREEIARAGTADRRWVTAAQSEDTLRLALASPPMAGLGVEDLANLVSSAARYDAYYGTRRCADAAPEDRLAQLLAILQLVLSDLPNCMLELEEVKQLLRGAAIALLPEAPAPLAVDSGRRHVELVTLDDHIVHSDVESEARFRWKTGHHLFSLYIQQATEELLLFCQADDQARSTYLADNASELLRAATSAMWYSAAIPPAVYRTIIRRDMERASDGGPGFSGTDNLDYRLFRDASALATSTVTRAYGDPADWPDMIWTALYRLLDTCQLVLEHHTLLANKTIGSQPSLQQTRLSRSASRDAPGADVPAVESLRAMAERARRRKEDLL